MQRFLSIGECMMELAPAGDGLLRPGFAGDTFNTAWYARHLAPHVDVAYLSAIGTDRASGQLEVFVRAAGIVPEFAVRADRGIGLYLIHLDNGERSFSYWRSASAARTLADDLIALPGLARGDMVYFSGITLAILPEAGRARLLALLAEARVAGVTIAFDPNLRPRLWPDTQTMCQVVMQGAAVADIALPSFDDEAQWFGDATPEDCATRYRMAGVGLVAVKDGSRPVLIDAQGVLAEVTPEPVAQVVDSTAAGDAFNAGFLMALDAGASPAQAARQGCRVSALVIGQRGALVTL